MAETKASARNLGRRAFGFGLSPYQVRSPELQILFREMNTRLTQRRLAARVGNSKIQPAMWHDGWMVIPCRKDTNKITSCKRMKLMSDS